MEKVVCLDDMDKAVKDAQKALRVAKLLADLAPLANEAYSVLVYDLEWRPEMVYRLLSNLFENSGKEAHRHFECLEGVVCVPRVSPTMVVTEDDARIATEVLAPVKKIVQKLQKIHKTA